MWHDLAMELNWQTRHWMKHCRRHLIAVILAGFAVLSK